MSQSKVDIAQSSPPDTTAVKVIAKQKIKEEGASPPFGATVERQDAGVGGGNSQADNSPDGQSQRADRLDGDIKDEDGIAGGENPETTGEPVLDEEYLYPDMLTRTEWTFNEMIRIPNRREALIQLVGNWRLIKFRKTYDTFECMQCGAALLIYKHPSFCEAKVVHKSCLRKDYSFDQGLVKKCPEASHKPFDEAHIRISGKTHASVRYFAKKHLMLTAPAIISRLKRVYPQMAKCFIPEMRKVNDIAARERKICGVSLPNQQPVDAGFSAEDIKNGGSGTLLKPDLPDNPNDAGMYTVARKRDMKQRVQKPQYTIQYDIEQFNLTRKEIQETIELYRLEQLRMYQSGAQNFATQRQGIIGLDEPNRVIQMVQSVTELLGYDYLIEWKQPQAGDKSSQPITTDGPQEFVLTRPGTVITPSIVKGAHLVTEAPYLYRQFVEAKYSKNNLVMSSMSLYSEEQQQSNVTTESKLK